MYDPFRVIRLSFRCPGVRRFAATPGCLLQSLSGYPATCCNPYRDTRLLAVIPIGVEVEELPSESRSVT